MITILHEQRRTDVADAQTDGEHLWLDRNDIERATGWTWKPEGLCRDETCVPLPHTAAPIVRDTRLDLAALWRHMNQPVVHDDSASTWVLGTGAAERAQRLTSLEAPDFGLPDLDGRQHRLSDYRGKRVFLATWASW